MKKYKLLIAALLIGALGANAVPAKRVYRDYTQPDGTIVRAMLVGDEFGHYYLTDDNIPMQVDSDGYMRYIRVGAAGSIEMSAMPASNKSQRSISAGNFIKAIDENVLTNAIADNAMKLREKRSEISSSVNLRKAPDDTKLPQSGLGLFTSNYPRTGEVRSLVFLVEYQDVRFRTPDPLQYFTDQLNKEGFSENGATGSARDYFLEQSHGQFSPSFDVFGPVTLPNNMAYYGANDRWGNDLRPELMVTQSAEMLSDQIDFSQYDFDGDGKVDNIYVIYAGLGEADGGSASTVWPHSYNIPDGPVLNGKQIDGYACSNEISQGVPCGIGTFCHEYSHVLGLPDLYNTTYSSSYTPCDWSIMDSGSYNNDSRTPPNYSSYERNALKWMTPTAVKGPESVILDPLHASNEAYLIPTQNVYEFFLLENRQNEGWDKYLPGHGMLVWHIDFNQTVWDNNTVNNNSRHQYVDIVEANGRTGSAASTLAAYTFPGTHNVTSLTQTTSPALRDWNGNAIDYPITDIKETDGIITFDISGGAVSVETPSGLTASATETGSVIISWTPVDGATGYSLSFYTKNESGEAVTVGDYNDLVIGAETSHTIEGLESATEYFARVRAHIGRNMSDFSEEVSATTPELDFIHTTPVAIDCTAQGSGKALLTWEALDGAEKYLVTVESEIIAEDLDHTLDFGSHNDTELSLPEGWTWNGKDTDCYTSVSGGFFGQDSPSLKFQTDQATLTSPLYEVNIKKISFWLRGGTANIHNTLDIEGRSDENGEWVIIKRFESLNAYNSRGTILNAEPAEGIRQIRFVYTRLGGSVALDDLTITTAGHVYTPYIDRADAGAELSYTVDIPADATALRFYVEGVDSEGRISRRSNTVSAQMPESGISSPGAAGEAVAVLGRTIVYSGLAESRINVYTLSGALIGSATASTDGTALFELPSAGIYIVSTPSGAKKTVVK